MVHPDLFPKSISDKVNDDAKSDEVKDDVKMLVVEIEVRQQFTNDKVFNARQHMLEWVRMEANEFGFGVVIGRSDNDTSRMHAFVTMRCERGGKYVSKIWMSKHDDTKLTKCKCPFKLRESTRVDDTWQFSVISGKHNHSLETKLQGHPIIGRLKSEEK
ncbi:uncharacterized protein LOC131618965 [Vicia villosa]|uniref:uncharacterized protein LOC131618965 n=1 Tax=Vicia villosa TaxID=3911 RepID=UPI00273BB6DF|nr:uncharacterized protein LOC131618965 [Vicia villosa]